MLCIGIGHILVHLNPSSLTYLDGFLQHYEREIAVLKQRSTLEAEKSFCSRLQKLQEKMDAKLQAKDKKTKDLEEVKLCC